MDAADITPVVWIQSEKITGYLCAKWPQTALKPIISSQNRGSQEKIDFRGFVSKTLFRKLLTGVLFSDIISVIHAFNADGYLLRKMCIFLLEI